MDLIGCTSPEADNFPYPEKVHCTGGSSHMEAVHKAESSWF